MSIAREIAEAAFIRYPGEETDLTSVTFDELEFLITAALKERDEKIRRVILVGTKVTCGECGGSGWFYQEFATPKEFCPVCEGSGEVLSEEAEEVLALLEGGK